MHECTLQSSVRLAVGHLMQGSSLVQLCFLSLPFFLLSDHSPAAAADDAYDRLSSVCDSANYYPTSGSVYESNLKNLLDALSSNASLSSYKSVSVGREPDKVEGLFLCRGDMTADECGSCLHFAARDILSLCPHNKNATAWYRGCYLHYSGGSFLSSGDNVPYVTLDNVENQTDAYGFVKLFRDAIMNSISHLAAYTSPNKYATAYLNFTELLSTTIYGMAQCTPDLTAEECNRCLRDLYDRMPKWFEGRKGGRVLGVRCAMRFDTEHFFQGTPMSMLTSAEDLSICMPLPASSNSLPVIGVGVGLCIVFLSMGIIVWSIWLYKKRQLIKMRTKFFKQNGGLLLQQQLSAQGIDASTKMFTVEELSKATSNFNEAQVLGRGGHGTVYKGVLRDHRVVAIKKSIQVHEREIEQFINEIVVLSQINHRNVVKLLGCCLETQVPLLVYEFIPNGTLFSHIHSEDLLPWKDRLRIAAETAGALAYLHGVASTSIIHRDVKSANILLDEHFTTKVADFGASRPIPFDRTHVTTRVQGTRGYLDPEYVHTGRLTEKSDVYSFGVVLAELLTGEVPMSQAQTAMLAFRFVCLFDRNHLIQTIETKILEEAGEEQLRKVAGVARSCLNTKGEERPTMKEVARLLEGLELETRCSRRHLTPQNVEELRLLLDGNRRAPNIAWSARRSFVRELFSSMYLPR